MVNGHPSYTVDQAAEQILREQASWQKAPGDSVLTLSYSFLTKPNDFFNTPWKYVSDIYSLGKFSAFSAQQQAQAKLSLQSWADVQYPLRRRRPGRSGRPDLRQLQQ